MRNIRNKRYYVAVNEAETDKPELRTIATSKLECLLNLAVILGYISPNDISEEEAKEWTIHKVSLTVIKTLK